MSRKKIIFILLFYILPHVEAQYYSVGQDRGSTKWRQINTTAFQIIFPDYYEETAKRIATILDSIPILVNHSLPAKIKKIPLVLHPQSVNSNGMVVWAPRRMEWWTCPPQDMYSQPWFEQLGIHEYRHVTQIQSIKKDFSGVLTAIFGEHITGAIVGLFIPNWFLEGDATVMETALSNAGRGREGNFQMETKAQVQEKGIYSYDKATFGSYHDFIPNKYNLGYYLVSFGREKYGFELWQKALKNVAKNPWQLNPFERAIKKNTSFNMNHFYINAIKYHDSIWREGSSSIEGGVYTILSPKANTYTQYFSLKILNKDSIIALKNSFEENYSFVIIDTKSEKKIRKTGYIYDNYFDFHGTSLAWCEIKQHPRWQNVTYSNLILYDLKTNKRKQISKNTRYFSPCFSPSEKEIVLIEDNELNQSRILIINPEDGSSQKLMDGGYETTFSYPIFSHDGENIYVIALQIDGKSIYKINKKTKHIDTCINATYSNIYHLKQKKEYLFYIADYLGTSQVFALNLGTKESYQVTNVLYGVSSFDISEDLKYIVYTSYTSDGYRVEKSDLSIKNKIYLPISKSAYPVAEDLSRQERNLLIADNINDSTYTIQKYSKWSHLFNFHSWAPVSIIPTGQTIKSGVSFMSQNILSTSFLDAGFVWNNEEEKGEIYLNYSYEGLYPILSSSLRYDGRQIKRNNTYILWNEFVLPIEIRVPFNYNKEEHLYGFSPYLYYEYKKMYPLQNYIYRITENQTLRAGFSIYNQQLRAYKHINPQWGQAGVINISKSFNDGINAWLFSAYGTFYFPSFVNTHNFSAYTGFQYNEKGSIVYSNQVSLARGYRNTSPELLFSNKLNYTLPLFYPDFSLGRILYTRRIYTTLFYDFMWSKEPFAPKVFNYSIGSEFHFNVNLFRFDTPINMGVRLSYLSSDNSINYDFLFSFSF